MQKKLLLIALILVFALAVFAGCNPTDDNPTPPVDEVTLDFPKGITVKNGVLGWRAVEGATSYCVYDGENVLADDLTQNSYDLSALSDGVYYFSVVAKDGAVSSPKSVGKYYVCDRFSKRISAGETHSLIIDRLGNLWGFGDNSFGQLGIDGTYSSTPQILVEGVRFNAVSAGGDFSIALDDEGYLWSWGCNSYGQLATGDLVSVSQPQKSPLNLKFSYISAGNSYALAIDDKGSVWAWGYNAEGKLGCGDRIDKKVPVKAKLSAKAVQVSAGYSHSVAIDVDGNMWGWGNNYFGQIGDIKFVENGVVTPTKITADKKIVRISAGLNRTLALSEEGELYDFGQEVDLSDAIKDTDRFSFVSVGNTGFVAVNKDGKIVVFDGTSAKTFDAENVINLATGGGHFLYGTTANEYFSYGNNISGQLGYSGIYSKFKKIEI